MAELTTACGATFLVDDDVAERASHLTWRLDKYGYVMRKTTVRGKKARTVFLHREVIGCSDSSVLVDHCDGNKLDNRRENLRLASISQNAQNRPKKPGCSSVFRGVTWSQRCRRWLARIKANDRTIHLGSFIDEHEAGHAYNRAAVQYHGEFARLNPVGSK